jgi:hypothetical protein
MKLYRMVRFKDKENRFIDGYFHYWVNGEGGVAVIEDTSGKFHELDNDNDSLTGEFYFKYPPLNYKLR